MTSTNASQTQLSRFGFNITKNKIHLSYFDIFTSLCCFSEHGMWWAVKWKPFSFFLFLCCSGLLSSMFSRSRPCWGWKLTTPCLWPRTRLLEKQWWPSTPSLSHRNTWRGVYLCTAQRWAKPFFSTSCKTEVVLVFKAGKEARNTNDTRELWLTAHIVVCRRWFDPQLHISHHWARYWTPNCSWWKFYMCKTCFIGIKKHYINTFEIRIQMNTRKEPPGRKKTRLT